MKGIKCQTSLGETLRRRPGHRRTLMTGASAIATNPADTVRVLHKVLCRVRPCEVCVMRNSVVSCPARRPVARLQQCWQCQVLRGVPHPQVWCQRSLVVFFTHCARRFGNDVSTDIVQVRAALFIRKLKRDLANWPLGCEHTASSSTPPSSEIHSKHVRCGLRAEGTSRNRKCTRWVDTRLASSECCKTMWFVTLCVARKCFQRKLYGKTSEYPSNTNGPSANICGDADGLW